MAGRWSIKIAENVEQRQEETEWFEDEISGGEVKALQAMGVQDKDTLKMVELDSLDFTGVKTQLTGDLLKGGVLFVSFDDYGWVLAIDGKPRGAYYCSSRGPLWQSEWVVRTEKGRTYMRGNNLVDGKWGEAEQFFEGGLGIAEDFLDEAEHQKKLV